MAHVQDAVEEVFGEQGQDIVGRALSGATFAPPILDPLDSQRYPTNSLLEKNRERLLKENYVAVDDDQSELWRISVRLGALERRRLRPVCVTAQAGRRTGGPRL